MSPPPAYSFQNKVLQSLPPDAIARLHLRSLSLPVDRELERTGQPIRNLFFLESGAASMTATFLDGKQAEVGLFGFESVIGASALMGTKLSLNRVYMQIPGYGYAAPLEAAQSEFRLGSRFQDLVLRYVQTQLVQATQSAGCNVSHHLEQRLARWLLLCADRSRTNIFELSQQFLGMMLGVQRSSINLVMGSFVEKGLIETRYGHIRILDMTALEHEACECYLVVKRHLDNFAEFDSGQRP